MLLLSRRQRTTPKPTALLFYPPSLTDFRSPFGVPRAVNGPTRFYRPVREGFIVGNFWVSLAAPDKFPGFRAYRSECPPSRSAGFPFTATTGYSSFGYFRAR